MHSVNQSTGNIYCFWSGKYVQIIIVEALSQCSGGELLATISQEVTGQQWGPFGSVDVWDTLYHPAAAAAAHGSFQRETLHGTMLTMWDSQISWKENRLRIFVEQRTIAEKLRLTRSSSSNAAALHSTIMTTQLTLTWKCKKTVTRQVQQNLLLFLACDLTVKGKLTFSANTQFTSGYLQWPWSAKHNDK